MLAMRRANFRDVAVRVHTFEWSISSHHWYTLIIVSWAISTASARRTPLPHEENDQDRQEPVIKLVEVGEVLCID